MVVTATVQAVRFPRTTPLVHVALQLQLQQPWLLQARETRRSTVGAAEGVVAAVVEELMAVAVVVADAAMVQAVVVDAEAAAPHSWPPPLPVLQRCDADRVKQRLRLQGWVPGRLTSLTMCCCAAASAARLHPAVAIAARHSSAERLAWQ